MTNLNFDSEMHVELVQHAAMDAMVVSAARVSTLGVNVVFLEQFSGILNETDKPGPGAATGLINFLMKNRHGCYDSETDVLTGEGWKRWPDVTGHESFATLNLNTGEIEYQYAEHLVRKHIDGPMIHIRQQNLDLLVTPDHKMVAAPRKHNNSINYGLYPAKDFLLRSHRIPIATGEWSGGDLHCPELAEIAGMIVADAHVGTSIEFNFRNNPKKAAWLRNRYPCLSERNGKFTLKKPHPDLIRWAKDTYAEDRSRKFPAELLRNGDAETLQALLAGYLAGDGSISPTGKVTCSTISRQLADEIQEVALKVGYGASETKPDTRRTGAYGSKTIYRLTILCKRNSEPRIGWTTTDRAREVTIQDYSGDIHCVTVPNGTLYVRRNGKPTWCGNTPFEHGMFTFRVTVPIFVMRELHRHRIMSYNEESGRYKKLDPHFYVPEPHRALTQVGKPGHYTYEPGSGKQVELTRKAIKCLCEDAWKTYATLLDNGIAKEVARMVLPVSIYSSCYVTCNPRSLMHFLSLRTKSEAAMFPSYPMQEISWMADKMEAEFARLMPVTHNAFCKNGRVSP